MKARQQPRRQVQVVPAFHEPVNACKGSDLENQDIPSSNEDSDVSIITFRSTKNTNMHATRAQHAHTHTHTHTSLEHAINIYPARATSSTDT